MLYLETGTISIRFIIFKRRIVFLHYLLNESETSLVNKFLKTQIEKPSKNDWINFVMKDLELLEISLSYDEIRVLSTAQFKILWTKVL